MVYQKCQALAAPDRDVVNAGNGKRQTAITIASVVGAVACAALIAGVLGLIFWVRRRRSQESIRDLSDLGALPHVSDAPAHAPVLCTCRAV